MISGPVITFIGMVIYCPLLYRLRARAVGRLRAFNIQSAETNMYMFKRAIPSAHGVRKTNARIYNMQEYMISEIYRARRICREHNDLCVAAVAI